MRWIEIMEGRSDRYADPVWDAEWGKDKPDRSNRIYNGVNGRLGIKHTDAAKEKVRVANLNKVYSQTTLDKLSQSMQGRTRSAETKAKQSANHVPRRAPSLAVITPDGTFPSISAAARAHGISSPAGLYRVKAGKWKLAGVSG